MSRHSLVLLPGDGVGPEVTHAARLVLQAVARRFGHDLAFAEHPIGGAAIDATGEPLPEATLQACVASDAVLLGAVGGPKWDGGAKRPEQGLLAIRKSMGLFANLRPAKIDDPLIDRSPLKAEAVRGVDILIVRELTGGVYFGERTRTATTASDLCAYSVEEIERVARIAFDAARGRRGKLTSVDKANVLETSRLWRETVVRLHRDYPDVTLEHQLVDSMAMKLITSPSSFDVVLTENMFGDILSDEASVLAGSIGLLGSASLGASGPGLFEPIHGSAPDIAGQDRANPIGAIRSAAMLLRYGLKLKAEAEAVEAAVGAAIAAGELTGDLGGALGTQAMAERIAARL
ncbi:3-isopropylmalate dehydrogenase [Caulobacter sp. S45]|uniref:3-isopropylmalate dehydrogenase n=1 Tax=Caulobacter sp. S45 TaxID=1641861 RepID=UPI001576DE66|nr:3-isopropylmalate dehydrogenase [Caulobacter sp. S45]